MAEPEDEPICRPWLIRALRRRPKLIDIEARDEFLEGLEENICERRRPDQVSKRLSRLGIRSAEGAAEPAVAGTVRTRFRRANRRLLRRL